MQILGNVDRLDREAWLLLLTSSLFSIATSLSSTFVNVYLFKIENDWMLISFFNVIHYLTAGATFIMGGWLAKKFDRIVAIRMGVAVLAVFYLSVWWLGVHSVSYVVLLGIVIGLGAGFYWLAYNVMYFEITEKDNRDIFNGVNGLCTSVAGIAAPFLSGIIISRMGEFQGYRVIFGISLSIFLCAVLVSFLFKARRARGHYRLGSILSLVKQKKAYWYWVNLAMIGQGLREGIFAFLLGLLFFIIVKSELALGSFFTFSSSVSCLSFYIVSRYMRPELRYRFMFIGVIMMGLAAFPFAFHINDWTIWILGVGSALFYPLYMSPLTSTVFDVIGETNETAELRVEYVVARELALSTGRIAGVLLFMWWIQYSTDIRHIRWFVLIISFIQILAWFAIRHIPVDRLLKLETGKRG